MNTTPPNATNETETAQPVTTQDEAPREPSFLRASFQLDVERPDAEEVLIADATLRVRLPSTAAMNEVSDVVASVLPMLLPLVASRFGVECRVASGGEHGPDCGRGKVPPPPAS